MKKYLFLPLIWLSILLFSSSATCETKAFIKEYTYQASEFDSKASSRILALEQVKRLLLEELGTYLESTTEVKNYQLTKDQIKTLTAGIVNTQILEEKWDGTIYFLKARISADPEEVIKSVIALRQDTKKSERIEDLTKRTAELTREVEELKRALEGKSEKADPKQYIQTVNKLSAIDWMKKAVTAMGDGKNPEKNKEAVEALTKALQLSPQWSDAYFMRALINYHFELSKDLDGIIADIDKAIKFYPAGEIETAYDSNAEHYSARAKAYKDKGNYSQSVRDLEMAITLNPSPSILNNGNTRPDTPAPRGTWGKQDFGEIIAHFPNDFRSYMFRGLYYEVFVFLDNKSYTPAMNDYKKAVALNPKSALSHYLLGNLYARRSSIIGMQKTPEEDQKEVKAGKAGLPVFKTVYPVDYKNSILHLSKAIQLNPKLKEAYSTRALIYLEAKEYKWAIEDYDKLIEFNPSHPGTYHDRAIAHKELGQYEEAIGDLTKAIKLKYQRDLRPDWPRSAYVIRGQVYEALEKYGDAISDYDKALEIEEKNLKTLKELTEGKWRCSGTAYDLYDKRAFAYKKIGKFERAIDDFTKAIDCVGETAPALPLEYGNRADVYMEMEKPGEAIKDYTKAIESNLKNNRDWIEDKADTTSYDCYIKRARAYEEIGNFQFALNDYRKAIEAVRDIPLFAGHAYDKMAKLYTSLGIYKEAIYIYTNLVKIHLSQNDRGDGLGYCYTQLGNINADIGNYAEALTNYDKAIDLKPLNSFLYMVRAGIYLDLKKYSQAIKDFDKAIELMPAESIAYYYRGLAFVDSGKFKQGIDDIKIAARLGHKEAQEKLKELKIDW